MRLKSLPFAVPFGGDQRADAIDNFSSGFDGIADNIQDLFLQGNLFVNVCGGFNVYQFGMAANGSGGGAGASSKTAS